MKSTTLIAAAALLCGAFASALTWAQMPPETRVEMRNAQGEPIGSATVIAGAGGSLTLRVQVTKLPPGPHGFHIHEVGKCEPPDFLSAGPHFNPLGKKHGRQNPDGSHAGDLPNLLVGLDGTAEVEVPIRFPVREPGLGTPGTALIIHANPDDEATDPDGNAGARLACGVVPKRGE
jgi:superoxide dismutase, Cu-Zn family